MQPISYRQQSQYIRIFLVFFLFVIFWICYREILISIEYTDEGVAKDISTIPHSDETVIIVVTPTHKRLERLPDMTKLSQTLRNVRNLHWIVVEDGNETVKAVDGILKRSGLFYVYLAAKTPPGTTIRGGSQRNLALEFIRENYKQQEAVVYFADDDNSYDLRLFNDYIRKVKKIGVWAVGLAGGAFVESPRVVNNKVVSWNVVFAPNRSFPVDMAGFAINVREILRAKPFFNETCANVYKQGPEPCFLLQFGLAWNELEPFGYGSETREILVWHTKTMKTTASGPTNGYLVEKDD